MPIEFHNELWPFVPKCMFVLVPLDNESSPDNSMIDRMDLDVSVHDML